MAEFIFWVCFLLIAGGALWYTSEQINGRL